MAGLAKVAHPLASFAQAFTVVRPGVHHRRNLNLRLPPRLLEAAESAPGERVAGLT
jgi:hypothetical protein